MIDLHSHILPGVDDGTGSMEEACALARAAVADGIRVMAATPHVRHDFPTSPARMEVGVGELRAALSAERIPLQILPGGEIALEMLADLDDDDLRRMGLGGNPRYVLLETPYAGWPPGLDQVLFQLQVRGFRVVLAHPERNGEVQARPELVRPLVDAGALMQVTAASLDGRLGSRTQKTGLRLIAMGCAHVLASDAHVPSVRRVGMGAAAEAIGDRDLAHWLTTDVPDAIIADRRIPDRPTRTGRHGWRHRRSR